MSILTLNTGSSSLKFALYEHRVQDLRERLRGQIEWLGAEPAVRITAANGKALHAQAWRSGEGPRSAQASLAYVLEWLTRLTSPVAVQAVGHRIVHGGTEYAGPIVLDESALAVLRRFNSLAPLHQPHNLAGVRAARDIFPSALQVGCFDTAFHRSHPWVNDVFALPYEFYDKGIRRYGFHGLSYEYLLGRLQVIDPQRARGRVVIAHLGSGASMCALLDGCSVGSTMGFSALDGLPMGTRCGQIDPGVLLYLMLDRQLSPMQLCDLLYHESGLKGLSGVSHDVRLLESHASPRAAQALAYFVFRVRREIGAMAAILGGLDAIVFSGGIGENAHALRGRILADFAWLGIHLNDERNAVNAQVVSADASPCTVFVLKTDEELMIARHTHKLMAEESQRQDRGDAA